MVAESKKRWILWTNAMADGMTVSVNRVSRLDERYDPTGAVGCEILEVGMRRDAFDDDMDDRVSLDIACRGVNLRISEKRTNERAHRFMSTDDDLQSLVGARLVAIELKSVANLIDDTDDYIMRDAAFVEIATDRGFVTLASYVEHTGYYGGFDLEINAFKWASADSAQEKNPTFTGVIPQNPAPLRLPDPLPATERVNWFGKSRGSLTGLVATTALHSPVVVVE